MVEKDKKQERRRILRTPNQGANQFSLVRALRAVINNAPFEETESTVIARGATAMRSANLNSASRLVLPAERRATVAAGAATHGSEAVATDVLDILSPLYDNLVLMQAGATMMTGLSGNVQLPAYSGSTVGWEGETTKPSADGAGTFSKVTFTPKRLTAYIDISNQFLIQDSANAEALLRADIARAIQQKLEATILGNVAASANAPKQPCHFERMAKMYDHELTQVTSLLYDGQCDRRAYKTP